MAVDETERVASQGKRVMPEIGLITAGMPPALALGEMRHLNRLLDRILNQMSQEWPWLSEFEEEPDARVSPVECFVQDGRLIIRAEHVPSAEPKNLNIGPLGNVLTRADEHKSRKEDRFPRGIAYRAFKCRVTVSDVAQTKNVKSEFKNGVVNIAPLGKDLRAKKIPLVAGG